jgi:photosystem II stability/assembly factor-like uncharacterized protein
MLFSFPLRGKAGMGALALALLASTAHAAPPAAPAALDQPALQSPKALGAAMLAVARAGKRLVAAGERGIVLISDDGGRQWQQAQVPVQVSLTALRFVDERRGWAVGHMGVVLATADGGLTWRKQLDGVRAAQLLAQAAAGGDEKQRQLAQRYVEEGPDKPFFDVEASDAAHAVVVGAYNLAFETLDGGQTWKPLSPRLPNPKGLHLYGVRMVGGQVYIAGEQGLLLKSADGGASFAPLASPYKGSFFGLLAARSGTLVAYGLRGNAFRSADGGASWEKLETGAPVSISGAAELPAGALALLNQLGQVLVSRDDGRTFTALALPPGGAPASALAPGVGNALVFASLRGMRSASAP